MMMTKENPKINLEKKRFAFLQIGLVLVCAFGLAAFEYSSIAIVDEPSEEDKTTITATQTETPSNLLFSAYKEESEVILQIIHDRIKVVDKQIVKQAQRYTDDYILNKSAKVIDTPDINPEFPGGHDAMSMWIAENLIIPDFAFPSYGTIYVKFIVSKSGRITNISLDKGIDPFYDEAALTVVEKMPKWTPGKYKGKHVNVRYNLPIKIKMN